MSTRFKVIPGFSGYLAGADGRIYSTRVWGANGGLGGKLHVLTPNMYDGYMRVVVAGKVIGAHRLVAMAFHGLPPTSRHKARHKDGIRTNNIPSNLRWGTAQDNADDRELHGNTARGHTNGRSKVTEITVRKIRRMGSGGFKVCDIARAVSMSSGGVRSILIGRTWSHVPLRVNESSSRPKLRTRPDRAAVMFYIYALIDPDTHKARYVGVTYRSPEERLVRHMESVRRDGRDDTPVCAWLRSLKESGLRPAIQCLQRVVGFDRARGSEARQIARLIAAGSPLLNVIKRGRA